MTTRRQVSRVLLTALGYAIVGAVLVGGGIPVPDTTGILLIMFSATVPMVLDRQR